MRHKAMRVLSGKVGVCLVTSGPGATNTITGIADAMIDSTPVVVIAGQVATAFLGNRCLSGGGSGGHYAAHHEVELSDPSCGRCGMGSGTRFLYSAERTSRVRLCWTLPRTLRWIRRNMCLPKWITCAAIVPVPEMEPEAIQQAADLINAAERPLVLVGQGVELGNAQNELRAFIEKADMPAGCTLLGLSALPTEHPLNKGMLGMHGNLGPNINTNKCDVLIAVGMRFDDRVTGKLSTYASQAKIIHFDIDPAEIDKNVKTDVAVLGNCERYPGCSDRIAETCRTQGMARTASCLMNRWRKKR